MSNLVFIICFLLFLFLLYALSKGMGKVSKKLEKQYVKELKVSLGETSNQIVDEEVKNIWIK